MTRDCGPKENDEPNDCLRRELDVEGRFGIAGIAKLDCEEGVEAILNIEHDIATTSRTAST